jgi:PleD family two-component response regulator
LSIGIANFPDNAKNINGLINIADGAFYGTKRKGRDKICNCTD